jgi:hypothetical protein
MSEKRENQFELCIRLGRERRAALPKDIAGLYTDRNLTAGSKLPPGMFVNERNRPERIKNSDPEIHRGSFIGKPLAVATADADLDDEPEQTEDATELSLSVTPITAGEDVVSDIEPEQSDEVEESEEESEIEVEESDGEGVA